MKIDVYEPLANFAGKEELRKEYTRRFRVMMGKALQSIGKDIETGEIKMEIDFTSLQKLAD